MLLAFFSSFAAAAGDFYDEGDRVEAIELVDQHGEAGAVDRFTKVVLLVRDRFASEILKDAFEETEASTLAARNIAYITDLSGTPLMAKNLFVVPGMRLKQYSILIDSEPVKTGRYPSKGGQVTLLFLEDLEIKRITYATVGSKVAELLELDRPGADSFAERE
jgi:hypothetical protein